MNMALQKLKLRDVCEIDGARNLHSNMPYVGMEDIESNTGRFLGQLTPRGVKSITFYFTPEHLLYGRLRPYLNKVLLPDFNGHCSTEIFPLKPKGLIDKTFLFYWITSEPILEKINKTCTGARMPRANMEQVLDLEMQVPTLQEQKRIVAVLDKACGAIAKAKISAEKNLANARELFDSYLKNVFANPGIGWEENNLGTVCEVKDGTHDSPQYLPEGIPFVTQKNITENGLDITNTKRISIADHENFYRRSNVSKGDILISMIGANRGMSCLVNEATVFSIKNVGLVKATPKVNQGYLLYFLKSPKAKEYISRYSKGGAQEFIGLTELRKFPILFAPLAEQGRIVAKLDAISAETNGLEAIYQQKFIDLDELKKSILQKAFSGELAGVKS